MLCEADRVALERAVHGIAVQLCERTSCLCTDSTVLAVQARVGEPLQRRSMSARLAAHQYGRGSHLDPDGIANLELRHCAVCNRDDAPRPASVLWSVPPASRTSKDMRRPTHPSWPPTSGFFDSNGQSPFLHRRCVNTKSTKRAYTVEVAPAMQVGVWRRKKRQRCTRMFRPDKPSEGIHVRQTPVASIRTSTSPGLRSSGWVTGWSSTNVIGPLAFSKNTAGAVLGICGFVMARAVRWMEGKAKETDRWARRN